MNKLLTLIKLEITNTLAIFLQFGKNKKRRIRSTVGIVLMVLGIAGVFAFYAYTILKYIPTGFFPYVLFFFLVFSWIMSIISTMATASGHLFGFRDMDTLMALPLTRSEILAAKLIAFVVTSFVTDLIFSVPLLSVFFYFNGVTLLQAVSAIIVLVFFPFIPIVLSGLLSFLFSLIVSKGKYKAYLKSIGGVVLMIGFLVLYYGYSFYLQDHPEDIPALLNVLSVVFKPISWASDGIYYEEPLKILYFVLLNLGAFALLVVLFQRVFLRVNNVLDEGFKEKNYVYKAAGQEGVLLTLLKRDFVFYFTTPSLMMNTIVGPLMLVVFSFMPTFATGGVSLNDLTAFFGLDSSIILYPMILFFLSIAPYTASCISVEGEGFWIVKSLPVKPNQLFLSKLLLHLVVCLPLCFISLGIFSFTLSIPFLKILPALLLVVAVLLFSGLLGLCVNMRNPKMVWTSITRVVKNSMSVTVTMLISMFVIAVVLIAAVYSLYRGISQDVVIYAVILFFALVDACLFYLVFGAGDKHYLKIPA